MLEHLGQIGIVEDCLPGSVVTATVNNADMTTTELALAQNSGNPHAAAYQG